MKDRVDLVLVEDALHQRVVGHIAARHADAADRPGAHEVRLGHIIPDQADDLGVGLDQRVREPRSQQARASGD